MAGAGYKLFNTGDVLTAAQVNTYLMEQSVMVFNNAAARTTALSGVVAEGMLSYLKDTNAVEVYDGANWVASDDPNAIQNSIVDAKGDLISASADNVPARLAVGNNGESLVADSTASTGLAYSPSGLTQPIINGAFDIAQRGTTTTTLSSTFLLDRWAASVSGGATGTQERVAGLTVGTQVFQYAWKFTASSNFTFMQMGQQIEFSNCYLLQNQQVTISFYAQANNSNAASTALIVRTRTAAGVDASCLFSGTAVGTTQTITTSAARYSITRTLPATFGALSLEFVLGTSGASGDGFTITGIQIDRGSVALPFRRAGGTLAGELAACQRYYWRTIGQAGASNDLLPATMFTTTQITGIVRFPVPMRTAATATFSAAGDFEFVWSAGTSTITAANIDRTSSESLNLRLTSSGLTVNGAGYVAIKSGSTKWLEASAEL